LHLVFTPLFRAQALHLIDRDRHELPSLDYNTIYVLRGGYKSFFESGFMVGFRRCASIVLWSKCALPRQNPWTAEDVLLTKPKPTYCVAVHFTLPSAQRACAGRV